MGFDSDYGAWLKGYFDIFHDFCKGIADKILAADNQDPYVIRWARYNSSYVRGFPDEKAILDSECLAKTLAIFMWDVTVSHGADHYSFGMNVPARHKFLRIRNFPPPTSGSPGTGPDTVDKVATGDDLFRMELAHKMFFMPHAMTPNLFETLYLFTDFGIQIMQVKPFKAKLEDFSKNTKYTYSWNTPYQPLTVDQAQEALKSEPPFPLDPSGRIPRDFAVIDVEPLELTIPASIQY